MPSQDQLDLIRFLEAHKIKPVLDRAFKEAQNFKDVTAPFKELLDSIEKGRALRAQKKGAQP